MVEALIANRNRLVYNRKVIPTVAARFSHEAFSRNLYPNRSPVGACFSREAFSRNLYPNRSPVGACFSREFW